MNSYDNSKMVPGEVDMTQPSKNNAYSAENIYNMIFCVLCNGHLALAMYPWQAYYHFLCHICTQITQIIPGILVTYLTIPYKAKNIKQYSIQDRLHM